MPCLVNFLAAAGDDSLWKPANYQLLLKMRHQSAQVRCRGGGMGVAWGADHWRIQGGGALGANAPPAVSEIGGNLHIS